MGQNRAEAKGGKRGDRRREPRIKSKIKVKIRLKKNNSNISEKGEDFLAFTSEVSTGGLRLLLPLKLEREQVAEMELYLPLLNKILKLEAEVRWQKPSFIGGLYETGFEFKTISAEDKISLLEFIYLHAFKRGLKGGKA